MLQIKFDQNLDISFSRVFLLANQLGKYKLSKLRPNFTTDLENLNNFENRSPRDASKQFWANCTQQFSRKSQLSCFAIFSKSSHLGYLTNITSIRLKARCQTMLQISFQDHLCLIFACKIAIKAFIQCLQSLPLMLAGISS